MMDELVKKQDVIDAVHYYIESGYKCDIFQELKNLPSAGPERKKGKWIDGMLYYDFDESEWEKVKCSVCEKFVTKQIFYHDNKYHYCPYCGADMRGEHE